MKYQVKKYLITMTSNDKMEGRHKEYRRGRVYNIDGVEIGGIQRGGIVLTHIASGLYLPKDYATYKDFESDVKNFKNFLKEHGETLKKATEALKDLPIYEG